MDGNSKGQHTKPTWPDSSGAASNVDHPNSAPTATDADTPRNSVSEKAAVKRANGQTNNQIPKEEREPTLRSLL